MLTRKLNPRWTLEKADAAMLAEAEQIKLTWCRFKLWRLSKIEQEYRFYQYDREWPES